MKWLWSPSSSGLYSPRSRMTFCTKHNTKHTGEDSIGMEDKIGKRANLMLILCAIRPGAITISAAVDTPEPCMNYIKAVVIAQLRYVEI